MLYARHVFKEKNYRHKYHIICSNKTSILAIYPQLYSNLCPNTIYSCKKCSTKSYHKVDLFLLRAHLLYHMQSFCYLYGMETNFYDDHNIITTA